MKRIIVRIENHWRSWHFNRRQVVNITIAGVTILGVRVDKKYIALEIFNFDVMAIFSQEDSRNS